jgi:HPt (histidine-containing phosphotransfer) domain-containing protein
VTSLEQKIGELSARFAARASGERDAIAKALHTGDRAALIDRAHKLAGIAGMFGHPQIGEAALALEQAALAGADCAAPGEALLAQLGAL